MQDFTVSISALLSDTRARAVTNPEQVVVLCTPGLVRLVVSFHSLEVSNARSRAVRHRGRGVEDC
jgi:hypothetical protein